MSTLTIDEIKHANEEAGKYFFSPSTLSFFRSRTLCKTFAGPDGVVYFVTSEQFDEDSPRLYTIRVFDPEDGDVDTVGAFQAYETPDEAYAAIEAL